MQAAMVDLSIDEEQPVRLNQQQLALPALPAFPAFPSR
jgi:hypothetical protein